MTPMELYEIEAFRNAVRDDRSVPDKSRPSMLDSDLVADFVRLAKDNRPKLRNRSDEEVLELTGATLEGRPTLAGLMVLSDYPQQEYPNLGIIAIAVAGETIGQDEQGNSFLDNKHLEGPIAEMVDDAMAFVRRNTRTRTVVSEVRNSSFLRSSSQQVGNRETVWGHLGIRLESIPLANG